MDTTSAAGRRRSHENPGWSSFTDHSGQADSNSHLKNTTKLDSFDSLISFQTFPDSYFRPQNERATSVRRTTLNIGRAHLKDPTPLLPTLVKLRSQLWGDGLGKGAILIPNDRLLLNYYGSQTSQRLATTSPGNKNPFVHVILPLAFRTSWS